MDDNKLAHWLENEYDQGHTGDEAALAKYLEVLDNVSVSEVDADALFANIQSQVSSKADAQTFSLYKWVSSAAAIFALAIGAYFLFGSNGIRVASDSAIVNHVLPDQSNVTLKTGSALSYEGDFQDRIVNLEGEAFFEVKPGNSFRVKTDNGTVEVLGTSFNVFARDEYLMVDCKTGKVSVSSNGNSEILTPGERALIHNKTFEKSTIDTLKINSGIDGELVFERAPLGLVLTSMEVQFGVEFDTNALGFNELYDKIFTGSLAIDDFEKSLQIVLTVMEINHKIINENLVELF